MGVLVKLGKTASIVIVFVAVSLTGCAKSVPDRMIDVPPIQSDLPLEVRTLAVIIGDNDLTTVLKDKENLDPAMADASDAIGMISMGCTGTHIGNGVVVTAGHCFLMGMSSAIRKNIPCSQHKVYFGVRQNMEATSESVCSEVIQAEWSAKKDYAVFRLSNVPPVSAAFSKKPKLKLGMKLSVLSHPNSQPQQWSGFCKVGLKKEGKTNFFHHTCDTEKGSSGAGIFAFSKGRAILIGIHNRGVDQTNWGTPLSAIPIEVWKNAGL